MPKLIHFLKGVLLPFFQKRKKAVAAVSQESKAEEQIVDVVVKAEKSEQID